MKSLVSANLLICNDMLDLCQQDGDITENFPARDTATFNLTALDPDGGLPIFTDAFAPNWSDWSYATVNTAYTANVHGGTTAIRADLDGWGAFCPFFSNGQDWSKPEYRGLSTRGFDRLSFWVHRGDSAGGQSVGVQLSDVLPGWEWRHRSYFTVPTDNEWHEIVIPLSELDGVDIGLTRLAWMGDGNQTEAILLDDIRLLPSASPSGVTRDSMTTTADLSWLYRDERNSTLSTSWNEEHRFQGATTAHGPFSLAARFRWYGALQFRPLDYVWDNPPAFNLQNANTLIFSINRGANDNPDQRYDLYGLDVNGNVTFKAPITQYLSGGAFDLDPTTWQHVTVPVDRLLGTSDSLYAVGIQEMNGVNGWTGDWIYLDDVRFEYRAPSGTLSLYSGSLADTWNAGGSWDTTVDLATLSPVHDGANSIAVTYTAAWGGLYLQTNSPFNSLDVRTLSFRIHGGTVGGQQIEVWVRDGSNAASDHVAITAPTANTWTLVEIPVSAFGNPTTISAIAWQDRSGAEQPTFYLADIKLSTMPPAPPPPQAGPALSLDPSADVHPISPYIYGINFATEAIAADLRLPVRRWGGNSTTRYNWRTDTSNHASDWFFENIPEENANPAALPNGSAADRFVDQDKRTGTTSLLTMPLIGWTPKDRDYSCGFSVTKYGAQTSVDSWRPDCGDGRHPDATFISGNDPSDTSIAIGPDFVTAWINHVTTKYGGGQLYDLDNEPMLWNSTHRDVHPNPVTYDELRDRTYAYASAIKAADPKGKTLGPVLWGWCAYFYSAADGCGPGADREAHDNIDFIEWYLRQMRAYEQQHGVRILDYLDLHIYPQIDGVFSPTLGNASVQAARLRSTRQLWDTSYIHEGWIAQPVYLIPRMKQWAANNYPDTKLAITEYSWGALGYLNGALAQADILGIFGREGLDLATLWDPPSDAKAPGVFAFRMYRNYDGAGSAFGETSVHAVSTDQEKLAIYAARRGADNALTLMVINKTDQTLSSSLALSRYHPAAVAEVYRYSASDLTKIVRESDQGIAADGFTAEYPPNSISLFVIRSDALNGACGDAHGATLIAAPTANLCAGGAPTSVSGGGPWTWNCIGGYGGTSTQCTALLRTYTISTTAGANGSITPTATVNHGTNATVTVTPATGYNITAVLVDGLSQVIADPKSFVTLFSAVTANHTVAATFTLPDNVRIGSTGYQTLLTALAAVNDGETVKAREMEFPDDTVVFNRTGVMATLLGGYDSMFTTHTGFTTIKGPLTLSQGWLIINGLIIK